MSVGEKGKEASDEVGIREIKMTKYSIVVVKYICNPSLPNWLIPYFYILITRKSET